MDRYFCPLSGNYISQWIDRTRLARIELGFPSPVGELHFSIWDDSFVFGTWINSFRPLLGNYISQYFLWSQESMEGSSFRPLSGNYISQCYKASLRKSTHIHVSVPCRGTTFLNSNEWLTVKSVSKFPSPVGELHFSMIFTEWQNSSSSKFPSPVGELHFSMLSCFTSLRGFSSMFPSPVGELHFSMFYLKAIASQS